VVIIMRKLIHLMALVLFSSCTSIGYQEVSCEQLSASALRALMWQGMQPEQFQAWIGDTFHVSSANIHIDVAESGRRRLFQWQADGIGYRAVIQDGTLTDVSVSYVERRPEAGRF